MQTVRLALASARPLSAAGRIKAGGKWVFLGQDYLRLKDWEDALGEGFSRADISRLLDGEAQQLRAPFVEWVEGLNRKFGSDPDWWFNSISNRNPVESPLFLYVCYLNLIKNLSEGGMPSLIVAESRGLMEALRRLLEKKGYRVASDGDLRRRLSAPFIFLAYAGWSALGFIKGVVAARRSRPGGFKKEFPPSDSPPVMIDTYVYKDQLKEGVEFGDRHFPHLHEWLKRNGYGITVLPTVSGMRSFKDLVSVYGLMRRSPMRFIIQEDWLRPSDYLSAFSYALKTVLFSSKIKSFGGMDIGPVISEEALRAGGMRAKLLYRLPMRLKEAGFAPRLAINWFENQDIDKALDLGLRGAFPAARIIGAQPYNPFPNFLNLFPTRAEADFGVEPDFVVSCGSHQQRTFPGAFGSGVEYRVGAGLRFKYLWELSRRAEGNAVLVTLPARLSEAVELLSVLSGAASGLGGKARFYVKPHPDYTIEAVKDALGDGKWPGVFEPYEGDMAGMFQRASVVVSAGSGSALEAASVGIPVIIVGRQTALNFNPLYWFKGYWEVCFTSEEIGRALRRYLSLSETEKAEAGRLGEEIRGMCFEPVTEETLKAYVD